MYCRKPDMNRTGGVSGRQPEHNLALGFIFYGRRLPAHIHCYNARNRFLGVSLLHAVTSRKQIVTLDKHRPLPGGDVFGLPAW